MMVIAFILIILRIKQEEDNLFRKAKNLLNNRRALKTMCNNSENTFRVRITRMLLDMARKWWGGGG
jgi:Na+-transporting NADH:ubiquinone oxidoreductase subunit NqrC